MQPPEAFPQRIIPMYLMGFENYGQTSLTSVSNKALTSNINLSKVVIGGRLVIGGLPAGDPTHIPYRQQLPTQCMG